MEYVYGTKGSAHTDLTGYHEIEQKYPDQTITDSFRIVRKLDSQEDTEGNCYDWYEIDHHNRIVDKSGPVAEAGARNAANIDYLSMMSGIDLETAALLSKKALMRPIGSHNENERAAKMEQLLEDGINAIGLGPQGMGGKYSVMGVHIENTARHPSAIGVAVNVGCRSHRQGHIIFDKDLNYTILSHSEVTL